MTIDEAIDHLRGILQEADQRGRGRITLQVQAIPGRSIRLCGNRGPIGKVVNIKQTPQGFLAVAEFSAQRVAMFCRAAIAELEATR